MTRPWRMLVTGSRAWTDAQAIREALDILAEHAARAGVEQMVVAHGACYPRPDRDTRRTPARSADWLAHLWATRLPHPLPVADDPMPADWTAPCRPECTPGHRRQQGTRSICPAAGVYRNAALVAAGADAAIAFLLDDSSGTRDCIDRITAAGIRLQRVERYSPRPTVAAANSQEG